MILTRYMIIMIFMKYDYHDIYNMIIMIFMMYNYHDNFVSDIF